MWHLSITIHIKYIKWKNPKSYVKALNIFTLIYHDVHFWMTLLQTLFCYLIDTRKLGLMEYVICKKISFCHRIMQRSLFYETRCAQNFNYVNNRNLLSSINWNFVRVMNCLSRMTMISNASVRHPSKMQHIDLSRIINVLIDVACWKN